MNKEVIILKIKKTLMKNYRFNLMKLNKSFSLLYICIVIISCTSKPSPYVKINNKIGSVDVEINYNSPRVRDRVIWDELVPYNQVWRTGANEATRIKISKDILIYESVLKKGEYSFFTIPNKESWTVIFNNIPNQWGIYDYDSIKDVLRLKVMPIKSDKFFENLTFSINKNNISFNWENLSFILDIKEL